MLPLQGSTKPTKQYKGIHFGNMTSQRLDFGGKDGPGPGEYDPGARVNTAIEHVNMQVVDKGRYEANIPRYHEVIVKNEERKVQ